MKLTFKKIDSSTLKTTHTNAFGIGEMMRNGFKKLGMIDDGYGYNGSVCLLDRVGSVSYTFKQNGEIIIEAVTFIRDVIDDVKIRFAEFEIEIEIA